MTWQPYLLFSIICKKERINYRNTEQAAKPYLDKIVLTYLYMAKFLTHKNPEAQHQSLVSKYFSEQSYARYT